MLSSSRYSDHRQSLRSSVYADSDGPHYGTSAINSDDPSAVVSEVSIPDVVGEDELIDPNGRPPFSWKLFWLYTGPGWLMSIAYLDPGNLESDLQAGAYAGYQLIWVLFWSTMVGLALQILAARLGVVTGKHLAQMCRDEYSPGVSRLLWIMAEIAIIGGDIQQVVGSAVAFKILFGLPLWVGVLITAADTFTFLGLHAFGIRKLEAFFAMLIATMCVCFFMEFGVAAPAAKDILEGFIPEVSSYATVQAVSIVGAVIMPHNLFLHSALVQSREVDRTRKHKIREANFYFSLEAFAALLVSFFINLSIVAVFANGFFDIECAKDGQARITNEAGELVCGSIGLEQAGEALRDFLGNKARTVWAIGLLAAGQSATMTGTFAGQYVMEGFLTWRVAVWKRVAITRAIALVPAVIVVLVTPQDSHSTDTLGEYLNVLQSVQLPFALFPILYFTSSKRVMGEFATGFKSQVILWLFSLVIIAINFYLVATEVLDFEVSGLPNAWWMWLILAIILLAYLAALTIVTKPHVMYAYRLFLIKLAVLCGGEEEKEVGADQIAVLDAEYEQPEKGSPAWIKEEEQRVAEYSNSMYAAHGGMTGDGLPLNVNNAADADLSRF